MFVRPYHLLSTTSVHEPFLALRPSNVNKYLPKKRIYNAPQPHGTYVLCPTNNTSPIQYLQLFLNHTAYRYNSECKFSD